MFSNLKRVITLTLLASAASTVLAAPAPVSDLSGSNVASARTNESEVQRLERLLQNRNRVQLQLQQQVDNMALEISDLRGQLEQNNYEMQQMLQRQRELYQEIENRVSQAYTQPTAAPVVDQAQPSDAQSYSSDLSENEAYERAVALIMKDKRYDQAIPEFQKLLNDTTDVSYYPGNRNRGITLQMKDAALIGLILATDQSPKNDYQISSPSSKNYTGKYVGFKDEKSREASHQKWNQWWEANQSRYKLEVIEP